MEVNETSYKPFVFSPSFRSIIKRMEKIVIAGAPHSGKSTLIRSMRGLPAYQSNTLFLPEAAKMVKKDEDARASKDSNYKRIFPGDNYPKIRKLMIRKQLQLERASIDTRKYSKSIQDRSFIDQIGYDRLADVDGQMPSVHDMIKHAGYTAVLFCDFIEGYEQTSLRMESEQAARQNGAVMLETYQEVCEGLEIPLFNLPVLPKRERVDFAYDILQNLVTRP